MPRHIHYNNPMKTRSPYLYSPACPQDNYMSDEKCLLLGLKITFSHAISFTRTTKRDRTIGNTRQQTAFQKNFVAQQ